jgi:arylsulfatase A-like enzyme
MSIKLSIMQKNRLSRNCLALVLALLSPLLAAVERPNIVFILSDDHRWDAMGVMGHPYIDTPNLDRIAAEGVLFENAFVTSSLCSPSRASFLTGVYPQLHGVQNNFTAWDNGNVTFFEYLKEAGYSTAFIGKWHMPGGIPKLRGVDSFITFDHMGGQGAYYGTPFIANGERMVVGESPVPGVELSGYITEDLTELSLAWIEQNHQTPFALYLSHKALHLPMTPSKGWSGRYDEEPVQLPPEADSWLAFADGNFKHFLWDPLEAKMRDYAETAAAMDEQIGRIMAQLDELGLADNTVLIYAGDNGYLWGEHRLIDKRWSYEESIRIPFLVRYPARLVEPGRRNASMVLNLDLAPTLLELAGLEVPQRMQGRSLVPLIEDTEQSIREAWIYKYFEDFPYPVPEQTALRTDRYKLVTYKRGKQDELFDLLEDPREQHNLIEEPSMRKQLATMRSQMARNIAAIDAGATP